MRLLPALVILAGIAPAAAQSWLPMLSPPPMPRERPEVIAAPVAAPDAPTEDELAPADAPDPPQNEAEAAPVPAEPPFPLPRPRPEPKTEQPEAPAEAKQEPAEPRIYQVACPAVLMGRVEAKALPPVAENQCVAQSPLSLTGVLVGGRMIEVTGGVVTDCAVATMLPQWAEAIDGYLWARENARLETIMVGTSYMCRPRNNVEGADISEHGFADALDVIGFKLSDGRTVTVESGWADPVSEDGRLLRFAHDAACGLFTTTLGPEANALHRDHFHVDLGCHGKTCTARLCE